MDPAETIKATILDLVLRKENVYVLAACWSVLGAVRRMLPKASTHSLAVRLAPLYPIALCSVLIWIPGVQPEEISAGERVLVGLILGGAAGWAHKFYSQTIRGKDERISANEEEPRA